MRFRSAITGLFTSKADAQRNLATTIAEQTKPRTFYVERGFTLKPGDELRFDRGRAFVVSGDDPSHRLIPIAGA